MLSFSIFDISLAKQVIKLPLTFSKKSKQYYELIDIYHHFPVREIDWHHAIDYFNSHSDALKRYYPLFRMKFDFFSPNEDIAKALFINDEFYEFCMEKAYRSITLKEL